MTQVAEVVTAEVVSELTARSEEAARALWAEHYPRLAGWCASLVGDVDVAHDIAADSFERLLARWTRVEDPRAYLYVIATNRVRDHWRKQRRDRELNDRLRPSKEDSTTQPVDPWLRDLVMRLPERLRRPVLLHYYADLPVAEVAKALHRPVGTIKRALSEGRAHLLNDIEEHQ